MHILPILLVFFISTCVAICPYISPLHLKESERCLKQALPIAKLLYDKANDTIYYKLYTAYVLKDILDPDYVDVWLSRSKDMGLTWYSSFLKKDYYNEREPKLIFDEKTPRVDVAF